MAERSAPILDRDQLTAVLGLIRVAGTVELKLSVLDSDRRSAVGALELNLFEAQIRQVVFFDTPDLDVSDQGVVVRVRRTQRMPADSVVKLRPLDPEQLPAVLLALRKSRGFGVEVDVLPGGFVCSAVMKARLDSGKVRETLAGRWPLSKLFTSEQLALFEAHAPDGIALEGLKRLGPVKVLKLNLTPSEFGRRLVAELWTYPDGSRILELATKCQPAEVFQVAAETKAFMAGRGIDPGAVLQTETNTAMQLSAGELHAAAAGASDALSS
jgi:hypothetical protein